MTQTGLARRLAGRPPCPVCGTPDGTCAGHVPLSKSVVTHPKEAPVAGEGKVVLVKAHTRRGVAGWKNVPKGTKVVEADEAPAKRSADEPAEVISIPRSGG